MEDDAAPHSSVYTPKHFPAKNSTTDKNFSIKLYKFVRRRYLPISNNRVIKIPLQWYTTYKRALHIFNIKKHKYILMIVKRTKVLKNIPPIFEMNT